MRGEEGDRGADKSFKKLGFEGDVGRWRNGWRGPSPDSHNIGVI